MEHQIENRPYLEDASPFEIESIRNRVRIYEDGIIYLDELPIASPFSVKITFERVAALGRQFDRFDVLVDLRKSRRPDALTRRELNLRIRDLGNVRHISFCTGKNVLVNTAARFVMFQMPHRSFSIHKTVEEGIRKIKTQL